MYNFQKNKFSPSIEVEDFKLSQQGAKVSYEMSSHGSPDFEQHISQAFMLYEFMVRDNLPPVSEDEKNVLYMTFSGHLSTNLMSDIHNIAGRVWEEYNWNPQVQDILVNTDVVEFVERIDSWSLSQKIAMYHAIKAFWKKGQIWNTFTFSYYSTIGPDLVSEFR